ncbi:MAG: cell surface protein [Hydrogenophaga sp.]|nr:cell surface protein [Hydrogenophaga sp.]
MKKNVLASSVAAALVGLGMAGAAHANKVLVVPYYTAQAEHATLLNIVNTDTINGKIVKVRFRGAANSDDVFDFQAFLSPGDVWSGRVSSSEDGPAMMATEDASCTKPAKATLNSTPFVTSRLSSSLTAAQKANQTREGYVEIFAMADVPSAVVGQPDVNKDGVNDLYTAIKHVGGVAPCSGAAWTALDKATSNVGQRDTAVASAAAGLALGMVPPTPGLFSNFTIINVARAGAWDGEAENMSQFDIVDPLAANRVPYWPQTQVSVGADVNKLSADPLFLTGPDALNYAGVAVTSAAVAAAYYDLPDLSTPYAGDLSTPAVPAAQARALANILGTPSISNEFLVGPAEASTDWVFSMPTRRYAVAMNYAHTGAGDGRRFNALLNNNHFGVSNTVVVGGLICVTGISREIFNREEGTIANPDEVVISPSEIPPATAFCGEASVLSINGGGATTTETLSANVAVNDIDTTFQEGWMRLATPAAGGNATYYGLPVLGAAYTRALSGDSFFAGSWKHRTGFGVN